MDSNPPPLPYGSSSIFHFSSSNSSYSTSSFPILAIAIIGILATAFLLVSYYLFVIKCCLNLHQSDHHLHRFSLTGRSSGEGPIPGYATASVSGGLDDSLIRLIPVIQFRKEAKEKMKQTESEESEQIECAVCLSEFKGGDKLRIIPNCCHAFHIDCVDVWLQSNASCPVCRSSISLNTLCAIDSIPVMNTGPCPRNSTQMPSPGGISRNDDEYVVIEIERNNLDDPVFREEDRESDSDELSTISIIPSPWKAEETTKDLQTSFDDECIKERAEEDEFGRAHPIRRSFSMDLSSHRQNSWDIRKALEQSRNRWNETSSSEGRSSRRLRRSCFTFGGGRGGSRNAVLPLQLNS